MFRTHRTVPRTAPAEASVVLLSLTTCPTTMAPILRAQQRMAVGPCADGGAGLTLLTQQQSPPPSPLVASISKHREEFWDATITIPLRKALIRLQKQPSLPRHMYRSPAIRPNSPTLMSPTPESGALTVAPISPVSPPAHQIPIAQGLGCTPPLMTKALKRGYDDEEETISKGPTQMEKRRCTRGVREERTWGARNAANRREGERVHYGAAERTDGQVEKKIANRVLGQGDYAASYHKTAAFMECDALTMEDNRLSTYESVVFAVTWPPDATAQDKEASTPRRNRKVGRQKDAKTPAPKNIRSTATHSLAILGSQARQRLPVWSDSFRTH